MEIRQVKCRACNQTTETTFQSNKYNFITCLNPACALYRHTLTSDTYGAIDLAVYNGAKQHPMWGHRSTIAVIEPDVDSEGYEIEPTKEPGCDENETDDYGIMPPYRNMSAYWSK